MPPDPTPAGEFELIRWIRDHRQPLRGARGAILGIGDDCAILEPTPGAQLLVTTDMLMDGRHFRLEADDPEAVGYKAMGVNVSDIAAMAGIPRAAVVSVALPRAGAVALAQRLHAGLRRMADRFDVELIGGDTNAWDGPLVINVALLGETTARGAVRRSGARPGDLVAVTGPLGGSLYRGRHLRPEPRVREALELHANFNIRAMIDLSDGLSSDLGHILEESGGLGAVLDLDRIPIHEDARDLAASDGTSAILHALSDGEDFELCLVVDREEAMRQIGRPGIPALHVVGEVTAEPGLRARNPDGTVVPIKPSGFDHLRVSET
ncbi:thiamine-phosphate kinase [Aquisphaera insulae]|uniref:thiamine-phosphate kinase n=1 Tax=Aquisphaera insulae TaxID=2712864 RepID=UPI0013EC481F|nr:thiamine-phosphate kinase [Aquisphaera insulae]